MQRREFLVIAGSALLAACVHRESSGSGALNARAFAEERRFANTSYGDVAYVERGSGPAALFLHGFPLNGFQWRGALERLSPLRRCIAPDFLGLGFTRVREGQGVAPEDQVAMLVALLDALGVDAADVVANDSGGAVAQLLLATHPRRVRSLLLTNCDTEIESPPAAMLPVIELSRRGEWLDRWIAPWHADHALARSPDGIGGMCYADPAHPTDEAIATYFGPMLATERSRELAHAYAVALGRNALAGVGDALRKGTAPVRVVWGTADTIFSLDNVAHLERAFGNSRGVRSLDGSKLFWPEERPDVIAAEATALWRAGV